MARKEKGKKKRSNRKSERKNSNKSEKTEYDSDRSRNLIDMIDFNMASDFGFNLGPGAVSINY